MAGKIDEYIKARIESGKTTFVLKGGRRSGKTYAVLKFLLLYCRYYAGTVVNVASMTAEQGRLGAYADAKNIIGMAPVLFAGVEILRSPREIRFLNGSRMHFNQYSNSETAKGVACDWLFVNEANNFTKQQYVDLKANARKGTFIDYNPNVVFWVDEFFTPYDICVSTWRDNPYLTTAQHEYFHDLKRLAERPNASSVDKRNYAVYYLGQYSELSGNIFTPDDFHFADIDGVNLSNFKVFCDPSALRGSDWFACVLTARDAVGHVYLVDAFSVNTGTREGVYKRVEDWCRAYDGVDVYVETNGIIGIDFYEFCRNSGMDVHGWNSRGNKFERIVANYQNMKERLTISSHLQGGDFMKQVYDFEEHCEHDDNIDALNSALNLQMAGF